MERKKFYILLVVFSITLYSIGMFYTFKNDDMKDQIEYSEMAHAKLSLLDATYKAESKFPGMRVSSVNFDKDQKGQSFYALELLNDGFEQNIAINAMTGQITTITD